MNGKHRRILLLVDGNALIHRGFHAIPHLSTKKGEPTNGVYGFALLFLKAVKELAPKFVAVAFDLPGPTFRDKLYEPYKAKRVAAPAELYAQIPRVKELVRAFNLPIFEREGYEADDLIGSLAEEAKKEADLETVILTGDLDTLQLVDKNVKVFAPKKGITETKLYDEGAVRERYGLKPSQLVDFKALRGDPSDNIPGVRGIGEKTAIDLLQKFGTLEKIYEYLTDHPPLTPPIEGGERKKKISSPLMGEDKGGGEIKPRVAEALIRYRKDAELSRELAQIVKDLKPKLRLTLAQLASYDEEKVVRMFQELEFRSLLDKLPRRTPPTPSLIPHPFSRVKGEGAKGEFGIYELIDSKEAYDKFLNKLKKQTRIAIDTETTSKAPMEAELLGIGFCWEEDRAHYLPMNGSLKTSATLSTLSRKNVTGTFRFPEIKEILKDPDISKVGHNIKYDYLVLKRAGMNLSGIQFDTMIAAYLLNPGARAFDLDTLAFNEFGFRKTSIQSLLGSGKKQISMKDVPVRAVADYCGEDALCTFKLARKLELELERMKLMKIFQEIEMPLVAVLAEMEYCGIKIDPRILKALSKDASLGIKKLEGRIYRLAGEKFNIGSPIQLKKILFDKLNIPTEELRKGKTGLSTAATELEKLRGLHPIIDLLFSFRELSKLKNTYLDALPALINKQTKRLHTSFNQTITATGRLSSSDPNLQNIPFRTEFGKKIRRAFVSEKGYQLVSVDYSQIELRIAAHLSGDRKMIEVFKAGGDIHEATAKEIGVDRRAAKVINFGILYGLSAYGMKTRIPGVSAAQAQDFIDKYFEAYSELTSYLESVIAETREKGYVKNELGRIRNLPEINSSQVPVRRAAERAAVNMPIQSLEADIVKLAMNKLHQENLTSEADCKLLLQIHDSLVFEIAQDQAEQYAQEIVKIMEGVYKLKVPLVAVAKVGDNWEEMYPLSFLPLDKGEMKRG